MDRNEQDQVSTSRVKIDPHLRLNHVVGQPEGIDRLKDLVRRIKWPEVYQSWGVSKPKAIALVGPPGVGKTFAIRALANEVDCPLLELKYEDVATHLYDEAIRRLSLFKEQAEAIAKEYGHVLILIDEAEVFFRSRFDVNTHNSDEKKTNFFLRWIDGDLEGADGFTIIASSNAWDTVDPAMRRSGRFIRIDFKSLSPEDVLKALLIHMDLAEIRTGRTLFDRTDLFQLRDSLPEITGADVKEIIDQTLLNKANNQLDLLLAQDAGNIIELSELGADLITASDVGTVVDQYKKQNKLLQKRGVGF
jgi:ATP-dependent 26S proteasome regulatory subunit